MHWAGGKGTGGNPGFWIRRLFLTAGEKGEAQKKWRHMMARFFFYLISFSFPDAGAGIRAGAGQLGGSRNHAMHSRRHCSMSTCEMGEMST